MRVASLVFETLFETKFKRYVSHYLIWILSFHAILGSSGGWWVTYFADPSKVCPSHQHPLLRGLNLFALHGRARARAHCCIGSTSPTACSGWVTSAFLVQSPADFFQWLCFGVQRHLVDSFWTRFYTLVGQICRGTELDLPLATR